MDRSTWKKGERRVAHFFGSQRNPLSGSNSRHSSSDSLHDKLFIEVKHRQSFPQQKLWEDTVKEAKKEGKIPAVVFLKKGNHNPIILCRLSDLKNIGHEVVENPEEDAMDEDFEKGPAEPEANIYTCSNCGKEGKYLPEEWTGRETTECKHCGHTLSVCSGFIDAYL